VFTGSAARGPLRQGSPEGPAWAVLALFCGARGVVSERLLGWEVLARIHSGQRWLAGRPCFLIPEFRIGLPLLMESRPLDDHDSSAHARGGFWRSHGRAGWLLGCSYFRAESASRQRKPPLIAGRGSTVRVKLVTPNKPAASGIGPTRSSVDGVEPESPQILNNRPDILARPRKGLSRSMDQLEKWPS